MTWLSVVLHILTAGIIATASAMALRMFGLPSWVGALIGLIAYGILMIGSWIGDRFKQAQ